VLFRAAARPKPFFSVGFFVASDLLNLSISCFKAPLRENIFLQLFLSHPLNF
jgi:hypothetical protein